MKSQVAPTKSVPKKVIVGSIIAVLVVVLGLFSAIYLPIGGEDLTREVCLCSENSYNCTDYDTKQAAQECFDYCYPDAGDIHYLDTDEDGKACELLP